MFTNEEIMRISMQQSAWDLNANIDDFNRNRSLHDNSTEKEEKGIS